MKKILNEWKKFTVTESLDKSLEAALKVPVPKDFLKTLNEYTGEVTYYPQWVEFYSSKVLPNLDNLPRYAHKPKQVESNALSGMSFEFAASREPTAREVIAKKIEIYLANAPEEHKQFFKNNFDAIMDYAKQTEDTTGAQYGTGNQYRGGTSFSGRMTDFYMYGEGFYITKDEFKKALLPMDSDGEAALDDEETADATDPQVEPQVTMTQKELAPASDAFMSRFSHLLGDK